MLGVKYYVNAGTLEMATSPGPMHDGKAEFYTISTNEYVGTVEGGMLDRRDMPKEQRVKLLRHYHRMYSREQRNAVDAGSPHFIDLQVSRGFKELYFIEAIDGDVQLPCHLYYVSPKSYPNNPSITITDSGLMLTHRYVERSIVEACIRHAKQWFG